MVRLRDDGMPVLFDWELTEGPCGASVDQHRAIEAVHEALREAPLGTRGVVREVALSTFATYEAMRTVGRGVRDEATGAIVWWEGSSDAPRSGL